MGKTVLFVVFLCIFGCASGQEFGGNFRSDTRFLAYLMEEGLYQDAVTATERLYLAWPGQAKRDSLAYYKAWAYWELGRDFPAASSLAQIKDTGHPYFERAQLYLDFLLYKDTSINQYLLRDLVGYTFQDTGLEQTRLYFVYLQLGQRELNDSATCRVFGIPEAQRLRFGEDECQSNCFSSHVLPSYKPFVPTLASALLPGAGFFWMDQPLTATFLLVQQGFFGLQAWEAARKTGTGDARFIAFVSLSSVFYLSSVAGTYWYAKRNYRKSKRLRRACLGDCMRARLPAWP